jgi:hypothetical protein
VGSAKKQLHIYRTNRRLMKNFVCIVLVAWMFTSCTKETSDGFSPYPNSPLNDTTWSLQVAGDAPANQLLESLRFSAKLDSFNAVTGASIRVSEFADVIIPANAFASNGTVTGGNIKVEVTHLRKKGDLVRFAKPTTSYGRLLETSTGTFYIRAIKEGQELSLAQNKYVKIKFRDSLLTNDMRVFYGEQNIAPPYPLGTNPAFTWFQAMDTSSVRTFSQVDSFGNTIKGYDMSTARTKWINSEYFIDTLQTTRTKLNVVLPPNFTNKNTTVFAVFKDRKIVVQLEPELSSRSFYTVNIPVSRNITLVTLSKIGDDLYLGNKSIISAPNHPEVITPEKKTKAQISLFLDSL